MIRPQRRSTNLRLRRRVGRCDAASRNNEFANSRDGLFGVNAERENSVELSFRDFDPQAKTSVCL